MAKPAEATQTIEVTPVVIDVEKQKDVPVIIQNPGALNTAVVAKSEGMTKSPTTTEEDDRVTAGQRYVNRLWEHTQASIAIGVTFTTCFVLAFLTIMSVLKDVELSSNALLLVGYLVVQSTSIITSYFTRTNHVRQGGVGPKATEEYVGR